MGNAATTTTQKERTREILLSWNTFAESYFPFANVADEHDLMRTIQSKLKQPNQEFPAPETVDFYRDQFTDIERYSRRVGGLTPYFSSRLAEVFDAAVHTTITREPSAACRWDSAEMLRVRQSGNVERMMRALKRSGGASQADNVSEYTSKLIVQSLPEKTLLSSDVIDVLVNKLFSEVQDKAITA